MLLVTSIYSRLGEGGGERERETGEGGEEEGAWFSPAVPSHSVIK